MTEYNPELVQMLLEDRINGKTYLELEAKHGIPAIECKAIVLEALNSTSMNDPVEMRGIIMLRMEKVIEYLWAGLQAGNFKNAEAIVKATERLSTLLDLDKATIKHELTVISDEETMKVLDVMEANNKRLFAYISELPLNKKSQEALEAWPQWTATAMTEAVEEVIYAEVEDD